jgi:NAD(P)-dependent dehydrogenase (short-subunit alcohol dehydrogenase family)
MTDLTGKTAIVTGAGGGGIGKTFSEALAKAGAAVVVADLDGPGAEKNAAALRDAGRKAAAFQVDVRDVERTKELAKFAKDQFGSVDILMNNAAFMKPISQSILDYPPELLEMTFDVNFFGVLNCIRGVVPYMKAQNSGRILSISSVGAFMPAHMYGISKNAVQVLAANLVQPLGAHRITINTIAPGGMKTEAGDAARNNNPAVLKSFDAAPLGALGAPQELVGAMMYFLSDEAHWVTGQVLRVDGGLLKLPY